MTLGYALTVDPIPWTLRPAARANVESHGVRDAFGHPLKRRDAVRGLWRCEERAVGERQEIRYQRVALRLPQVEALRLILVRNRVTPISTPFWIG